MAPGHHQPEAAGGPPSSDLCHNAASPQFLKRGNCLLYATSGGFQVGSGGLIVTSGGFDRGLAFAALHRCL